MTRNRSFARIAAVALLAAVVAVPSFAQRGSADFKTFVAIGDSYGAGYNAGSMNANHQVFGWPAVVARQVGLTICQPTAAATDPCFALPLISLPGLPGGELVLAIVNGAATPVPVPGSGAPLMAGFGRPYNNLSVPGYTVGAVLALKGSEPTSGLGQVVLRGLGTEVDQAIAQNPTFIAVWIGGNDFLGAVSQGKPSLLTPAATFTTQYNAMLDKLIAAAPNAGMVIGSLPANFAATPLTGMLPGILLNPATGQPVIINGATVPLIADLGGGVIGPLPPGSIVLLSALSALRQGYGIPPAFKAVPPFSALPHVGEPLTDEQTITPAEQLAFGARLAEFNATITSAAQTRNIPVADIKGLFDTFAATTGTSAKPLVFGPFSITNTYATGGLFSLDGVHLTDLGYILFANEYIKAINRGYGIEIPLASISQVFQNNDPATQKALGLGPLSFGPDVGAQMIAVFHSASVPAPPPRRRSVH